MTVSEMVLEGLVADVEILEVSDDDWAWYLEASYSDPAEWGDPA